MANKIYYRLESIKHKQEVDKQCRERRQEAKKINAIKRLQKSKVLEELRKRIDKGKLSVGSGNEIEVSKLMAIIDEMEEEEISPRRFC